jgi:hypothetical protein
VTDKYRYAILDENGSCWVVIDGGTEKVEGLPSLMRQGWKPVRETPYVSGRRAAMYILICLERE